ncbi:MAG: putative lipid II flippase FtsW [Actinomycetales bacterium]|nr:putative lipid II flippase FtsW [Actinomycetales bacterium]
MSTATHQRAAEQEPAAVTHARLRTFITWTTAAVVLFGTVMVFSASTVLSYKNHDNAYTYGVRHVLSVAGGTVFLVLARRRQPSWWRRAAWVTLVACLAMQLFALVRGAAIGGQRNWIDVGFTTIQPSEFAKIGLILALAMVLSENQARGQSWRQIWLASGLVACAVIGLVALGGDLGTPIVLVVIALGMVFLAGANVRLLVYFIVGALVLGGGLISIKGYRMDRISAWFDPFNYKGEAGYQAVHGRFALGGGGILGEGLGSGREKWGGLPAAHTDFILAATGEETGIIGAGLLVIALIALVLAVLRVAMLQTDPFSRYVVGGIAVWLSSQALVNIAMVVGWAPVVGITLPFVSFGGSSMLATLAAVGIVLSYCDDSRRPPWWRRLRRAGV